MTTDLKTAIEAGWDNRDSIDSEDRSLKEAVEAAILRLDSGEERVAEKIGDEWQVNQWLKKAVLLSFRLNPMEAIAGGPGGALWWDDAAIEEVAFLNLVRRDGAPFSIATADGKQLEEGRDFERRV